MSIDIDDGMSHGGLVGLSRDEREIERLSAEVKKLRADLAAEKGRSFQDARISYMGFSYGVGSQWGIDSLRSAISKNGHG